MSRSTISVVIPTLNAERYLAATLASIVEQSSAHQNFDLEVIVVDGGSTDDTERIVRSSNLAAQWISAPGMNQAAAINLGFARSTGELLGWLNADDLFWPGALDTVDEAFRDQDSTVFMYGLAVAIDSAGRAYGQRRHIRAVVDREDLLRDDVIVQPAAFWRRPLWDEIGPLRTDLEYVFDYDFFIRVAGKYSLVHLLIPLAAERLHSQTKTATGSILRAAEIRQLLEEHIGRRDSLGTFSAEVAAMYHLDALRTATHGKFREALEIFRRTPSARPHRVASALRVLSTLPFGERGFVRLLLVVTAAENIVRGRRLRPAKARFIRTASHAAGSPASSLEGSS